MAIEDYAATLRPTPPTTKPSGEAVAWRYRYGKKGSWKYTEYVSDTNPSEVYARQPLYASPQPGGDARAVEFIRAAANIFRRSVQHGFLRAETVEWLNASDAFLATLPQTTSKEPK